MCGVAIDPWKVRADNRCGLCRQPILPLNRATLASASRYYGSDSSGSTRESRKGVFSPCVESSYCSASWR
ncbi:hypothetical protein SPHINGOAX6_50246 [Sphingomonas sp. AX6]|nr:hypothetical protein SPHINGOAX6_50246 [Sphingomonas sp. AX6]